jgi:hypothetical protein
VRRDGTLRSYRHEGLSASFFRDGRISSLRNEKLHIYVGNGGHRVITSHLPDGRIRVSTGPNSGYVERTIVLAGNRPVLLRTYVHGDAVYTTAYIAYDFHGVVLYRYVPAAQFNPNLYGWVYHPWRTPIAFDFNASGIGGSYRGAYFQPENTYASGYSWLADFNISDVLSKCLTAANTRSEQFESDFIPAPAPTQSTDADQDAVPPADRHSEAPADTPITPATKDAIADEIRRQIQFASAESQGEKDVVKTSLPNSLDIDRVFLVSSAFDVTTANEETCSLSGGDVLQLAEVPPAGAPTAQARVASSKRADCPVGEFVAVSFTNLQEMQNSMRAEIDAGLRILRDHQGVSGWPQVPANAAPPPLPTFVAGALPDRDAASLLTGLREDAFQVERGALAKAFVQ